MNTDAMLAMESLVEDMGLLPDAQERLAALAAWGRQAPELDAARADEGNRVAGCISRVHLAGHLDGGCAVFALSADSAMVRGLAGVTVRLACGATPASIVNCDFDWPKRLGLDGHITPTRLNGLAAVAARLRDLARAL